MDAVRSVTRSPGVTGWRACVDRACGSASAPLTRILESIARHERDVRSLSDAELQARVTAMRAARNSRPRAELRAEFFALVREAARRALGLRPFDVQVVAALALDDGAVVEMQTGEGKTLAAVMPAALHALAGRGVHVLTFNDYLARRDAEWMGPVYRAARPLGRRRRSRA